MHLQQTQSSNYLRLRAFSHAAAKTTPRTISMKGVFGVIWLSLSFFLSFFLSFSLSLSLSLPSFPLCVYVCEWNQHSLVPSQVPSPPRPPRLLRLLLVPSQVPSHHRNVCRFRGRFWGEWGGGVCLSVSLYLPLSVLCVCDYLSFSLRVCLCLCVCDSPSLPPCVSVCVTISVCVSG